MGTLSQQFPKDLFFGFDSIFDAIENPMRTVKQTQGYPPYNVVKRDENQFRIEIAVAGFNADDINLTLDKGQLTIKGDKKKHDDVVDTDADVEYLHRGISARAFSRVFTLADTMTVLGADIVDGMLLVGLENVIPEKDKPRTINLGGLSNNAEKLLLG